MGVFPAGEGRPQCGQEGARVETSRPQSGQAMTGMRGIVTGQNGQSSQPEPQQVGSAAGRQRGAGAGSGGVSTWDC
jgi:hypothetical protein